MSKPHRGPCSGRALFELAKRASSLAIDVREKTAECHASRRERADSLVMLARRLASDLEELAVDSSAIEAKAALPIIAAIEAREGHAREPANIERADPPGKVPSDWRSVSVTTLEGISTQVFRLCWDSEIMTAGEAWDQIEAASLSPHFWTHPEARQLEAAIVALRAAAGDPAPFTASMPPESATKVMDLPHLDAPGGPDWRPAFPVATVPEGMFTFEVIEKQGQKAGGHIQFWSASLPDAIEHARINWPGLHVRPCPAERDLANQVGSDGRPKTLPETIEKYGKKGPGRPPVEKPAKVPIAVVRSWRVFNLDGVSLATVESSSEEGAKKKARKLHPGVRLGCVEEVRSLSY